MDELLLRAAFAGVGVAIVAGPLGAFVVWRRMAYFGDSLAHSTLLGIALGLVIGVDMYVGVFVVCVTVAAVLVVMQRYSDVAMDTLLGVLAHGTLALGLVMIAVQGSARVDLMAYLFGDILAVTMIDLYWIYGGGAVIAVGLAILWRPLLMATVHEDLAIVDGVPVMWVRLGFMILLAAVVVLAMKVVGVLLVTSLLIIPPGAARRMASTPEGMAALAALVGCVAVIGGLWGSVKWDTPSGPSIVVAALVLFVAGLIVPKFRPRCWRKFRRN